MRLRSFVTSFMLFLLMLYLMLFLISMFIFNSQIRAAKEQGINEHALIAASLGKDLAAMSARGGLSEVELQPLFDFYKQYYSSASVFLEIERDGFVLYSSLPEGSKGLSDEKKSYPKSKTVSVRESGDGIFIHVFGAIPGTEGFRLKYVHNISENIETWRDAWQALLCAALFFSAAEAIFLGLSLERVFRPLALVSTASKKIASGEYGHRIEVKGSDETAEMAGNFNYMAEEISKRLLNLAELSEKKQNFTDNFSHEIRTPLTAIFGYAEYLRNTAADEMERYEYLGRIEKECRHMLDTAESMLELASLRAPEITTEKVGINRLFQEVYEILKPRLDEKHVILDWENIDGSLAGDRTLLKSLLINLTDNAIKACRSGGHIIWNMADSPGGKILSVEDDGKGMPEDEIERITEPFYRVDKAGSRAQGGAGLGLSICEQICRCHNALLSFESSPGEGTKVSITFTSPQ